MAMSDKNEQPDSRIGQGSGNSPDSRVGQGSGVGRQAEAAEVNDPNPSAHVSEMDDSTAGGGLTHRLTQQSGDLLSVGDRPTHRSQRVGHQPTLQSHPPAEVICISGTSNMTFQALASAVLPDLAMIKGSRQTRCLPRRKRS